MFSLIKIICKKNLYVLFYIGKIGDIFFFIGMEDIVVI